MKINLESSEYLNGDYQFTLKNKQDEKDLSASDLVSSSFEFLPVSVEDVNRLNIVLNNNNCSDAFFNRICDELESSGLSFERVYGPLKDNYDNCTVITLDMQYSAGDNTLFFAPYDNTRIGYSDSLTLAMQSGFQKNGLTHTKVVSGRVGFRIDEDGNVLHYIPTDTEDAMDTNQNVSFTTISLGTTATDPVVIASSIRDGLVRQKYFLDHYDTGMDLIYKTSPGEEVSIIADYFGTSVHDLSVMNQFKGLDVLDERSIINPNIQKMPVFDSNTFLQVQEVQSKTY